MRPSQRDAESTMIALGRLRAELARQGVAAPWSSAWETYLRDVIKVEAHRRERRRAQTRDAARRYRKRQREARQPAA